MFFIHQVCSLKKKPTPPLTGSVRPIAISRTSNPTPIGDLSTLPPELRDKIYRHICEDGSPFEFKGYCSTRGDSKKWHGSGLSMLQVSHPIREEFMLVLSSKAVFRVLDCS